LIAPELVSEADVVDRGEGQQQKITTTTFVVSTTTAATANAARFQQRRRCCSSKIAVARWRVQRRCRQEPAAYSSSDVASSLQEVPYPGSKIYLDARVAKLYDVERWFLDALLLKAPHQHTPC